MGNYPGNFFIGQAQVLLAEGMSTLPQSQTMLYPQHVWRTADEIARATFAVYGHVATSLVSTQPYYTLPYSAKQVRAVSIVDGNGNVRPVEYASPEEANQFRNQWNANTNVWEGLPEYYLVENQNQVNLFPVSNYAATNGLIVSAYQGVAEWWDMASLSPLPEWADELLTQGIVVRRCREMMMNDPRYAQVLPVYEKSYNDRLAAKVAEVQKQTSDLRAGPPPSNGTAGTVFGTVGSTTWVWWQ